MSVLRLLFAVSIIVAAAACDGSGPLRIRVPYSPSAPAFEGLATSVPMTMEKGIPMVEVTVNGKGPYRFVVDTGAMGHALINERLPKDLGLEEVGKVLAADPSGKNPIEVSRYKVSELKLGDIRFKDLTVSALPSRSERLQAIDGILGLPLFLEHTVTFNFAKGEFLLSQEHLGELGGNTVAYTSSPFITVPIKVGDNALNVHLDTGNGRGALIVSEAESNLLPTTGEAKDAGQGHTVSNTFNLFTLDLAAPVTFGTLTLPIKEVTYPSVVESGNLGSRGLEGLILRIDQKNHRVQITPG
jgi:hypothetical protein